MENGFQDLRRYFEYWLLGVMLLSLEVGVEVNRIVIRHLSGLGVVEALRPAIEYTHPSSYGSDVTAGHGYGMQVSTLGFG